MGKRPLSRLQIIVKGVVQGVGFRPFVYKLAAEHGLAGFARNTGHGVEVQVQGAEGRVRRFLSDLRRKAPPQASIGSLAVKPLRPLKEEGFFLAGSSGQGASAMIPADLAVCADCAREMSDRRDRRYGYPFTNCTNCGPRFTIVEKLPYDRPFTAMADFRMCADCRREYEDPLDRRFHAQPNACPVCGPQVFARKGGRLLKGDAALDAAAAALASGGIVALKSLGGYHLACSAANAHAVARLRKAKRRPFKPFAVMFPSLGHIRRHCSVSEREAELLSSPKAPIVMLAKRSQRVFPACAPGLVALGVMLPYTPLHFVLFKKLEKLGFHWPLVMTSGNYRDEPICISREQAERVLGGFADLLLHHDRRIHNRCDDSVAFVAASGVRLIRRARGYVPQPVALVGAGPQVFGCGAQLKGAFCLTRGAEAFLSQHIGDLDDERSLRFYRETLSKMKKLLSVSPRLIAHDLHPDYASTRLAKNLPGRKFAVQHHFAHLASVAAEHGLEGPFLGAALDGTGYGADGSVWGCEFMLVEGAKWSRLGTMRRTPLPGGDGAVLDIWKMGLSWLFSVYGEAWRVQAGRIFDGIGNRETEAVAQLCRTGVNSPLCSSMGRLFDAVAFLAGLGTSVSCEAQAAMELEALYRAEKASPGYRFDIARRGELLVADPEPLIRAAVADAGEAAAISSGFHAATAEMTVEMLCRLSKETGIKKAALSGGVFQNRVLLELVCDGLRRKGLKPYVNGLVPSNDGGIALGQCWAARKAAA